MASRIGSERSAALLRSLAIDGPSSSAELMARLSISQATFSRLVREAETELLIVGHSRATRYAARRALSGLGAQVPIYEIGEPGDVRKIATLHALRERRFYVEGLVEDAASGFHEDLPYFLEDLRPQGFIGRSVARQQLALGWPSLDRWSSDHVLEYRADAGWDGVGNLLVGDRAVERHLEQRARGPDDGVTRKSRAQRYPELAERALDGAPTASSAGGEQPKFLATRLPDRQALLVKFSGPSNAGSGRRWAELLASEQLALQVLAEHEQPAARAELVEAGGRVFLELERFDRLPNFGRRGLVSLAALAGRQGLAASDWSRATEALVSAKVVPDDVLRRVRWLELYGELIGNNDRHAGNLSFFMRGTRVLGLAPAYDMLPMLYRPVEGRLHDRELLLPTPSPRHSGIAQEVAAAALDLWRRVAAHDLVSKSFRQIARSNAAKVGRFAALAEALPQ